MMRKFLLPFAMLLTLGLTMVPVQKASADDFIDLDLGGVAPGVRSVFRNAERFWESRINGYSNTLPTEMRTQLTGRLTISATTAFVDGPGGILGFAGPDQVAQSFEFAGTRDRPLAVIQYAIPITSSMFFDVADAGRADFAETVLHEMGHALGIGTLWQQNGLFDPADPAWRLGLLQQKRSDPIYHYVGKHALQGFRRQSGHHGANYVPTDQGSLGHWENDNWFFNPRNGNKTELMTPFATGKPIFVSEATWGALADIGFSVDGFNAGDSTFVGPPGQPLFPKTFNAVPEPSSIILIGFGLLGLVVQRKRS